MPIGYIFWLIFIVYLVFRFMSYRQGPGWFPWGGDVIIIILLLLLGLAEFGFPLQGAGAGHRPFW
jgi:hypothetical protein